MKKKERRKMGRGKEKIVVCFRGGLKVVLRGPRISPGDN